ncbi:hypothetical protein BKE38_26550 [Pseudoroseomonas deserti]|uniref:Lipoprotein n=1 Tax=Teichococcus deserti TaxID=1817963 RepID=A0A1V2GX12_9PROT|nr:hypothetical protein [Pseudoroseomonas deserti]ONG45378.1 hypothetical protein BKE38_26550 [Pseudoroseomonas deserti]
MRHLVLAAAFALAACAQTSDPAASRASRTASPRPAAATASQRAAAPQADVRQLAATPDQLRRYEQAVARDLRDPRFSSTYLVGSDGDKGLCGFVSEKADNGRYTPRRMFYASLVDIEAGDTATAIAAPPLIASKVPLATIREKCGTGR